MSVKELDQLTILSQVVEKKVKQKEASERLGLCVRQIKRLLKKYREKGPAGLIHQLRGKPSAKGFQFEAGKLPLSKKLDSKFAIFLYQNLLVSSSFTPLRISEKPLF